MKLALRTASFAVSTLLLASCSNGEPSTTPIPGNEEGGPPTEEAPGPTEEPDEEPPEDDPFAVPDEIDEEYLQRVADELMAIRTDAVRLAVELNTEDADPDEELASLIGSIFTQASLAAAVNNFTDIVRANNVDEVFVAPEEMGEQRLEVFEYVGGGPDCVTFTGQFDFSATQVEFADDPPYFVVVLLHQPEEEDINPSGWKIAENQELFDLDTDEPVSGDDLRGLDLDAFADLLAVECETSDE